MFGFSLFSFFVLLGPCGLQWAHDSNYRVYVLWSICFSAGVLYDREFSREMHFSAFWKLAEKYFLVGMNSLGTLRRVYWEWLYANSSSLCSCLWRRLTFILFIYLFYLFICLIFYFLDSVIIIIVVIEIFLLGLFCPRLEWEYLCPALLGVLMTVLMIFHKVL